MSYSHPGPSWDPIAGATPGVTETVSRKSWRGCRASATTQDARNLQRSSRRTLKSILSPRDWVSYLYVPLFLLLFGAVPFWAYRTYRQVHTTTMLTAGIAETRQDYDTLLTLVQRGPVEPWQGMPYVDAAHLDPLFAEMGLDIITDTRITDLRALHPSARLAGNQEQPYVYVCRLVSVRKVQHVDGETGLRLQSLWDMPDLIVRCSNPELNPKLLRSKLDDSSSEQVRYAWQLELDFGEIPIGQTTNVMVEALLPADPAQLAGCGRDWWEFEVDADPEVATAWVLLPDHWRDAKTRLVRYENGRPDVPELVEPTHQAVMFDDSILNRIVVHPKAGYTYT
jgi:hypothetical protein